MAYRTNHEIPESVLVWQRARIAAGYGPTSARTSARHISTMSHSLNCLPEKLPADAVARHFMDRDSAPATANQYGESLKRWRRYVETGSVDGQLQNRRSPDAALWAWVDEHPDIAEWVMVLRTDLKANGTVEAYVKDLRAICRASNKAPGELGPEDIRKYLMVRQKSVMQTKGTPLKGSTQGRILSAVRSFCRETHREDITGYIKRVNRRVVHHPAIGQDSLRTLLSEGARQRDSRDGFYADLGRRMFTMTKLQSAMGMRVTEAGRVGPGLLQQIDGVWYIRAKGPIAKGMHAAPDIYLPVTGVILDDLMTNYQPDDTVCPRDWDRHKIGRTFNGWVKSLGVFGVTAHQLRAYYATHLYYRSNYNIMLVKRRLRHSRLETTAGYIANLDTHEERALVSTFDDDLITEPTAMDVGVPTGTDGRPNVIPMIRSGLVTV